MTRRLQQFELTLEQYEILNALARQPRPYAPEQLRDCLILSARHWAYLTPQRDGTALLSITPFGAQLLGLLREYLDRHQA